MNRIWIIVLPLLGGCTFWGATPVVTDCKNITSEGNKTTVSLHSKTFCDTRINLTPGSSYSFNLDVFTDDWKDGDKHKALRRDMLDETGWTVSELPFIYAGIALAQPFRRCANGNWFEIIGEVQRTEADYDRHRLGEGMSAGKVLRYDGAAKNTLILFANDLNFRYHNNEGEAIITIEHHPQGEGAQDRKEFFKCK